MNSPCLLGEILIFPYFRAMTKKHQIPPSVGFTVAVASGGLASPAALHWFKKKDVAVDGMVSNTQGKAIEKPIWLCLNMLG